MENIFAAFVPIAILLILSGFFSSSETALTALSKVKVAHLKAKGGKRGKLVFALRKQKDRMIGTILIGNNLVNILASALATKFFLEEVGENGVLVATVVMTILVIIVSEILPKTYAFYHSEKVSLFAAPILMFFTKIFSPLTSLIQKLIRLLGFTLKGNQNSFLSALEELRGTIDLHHKEGAVIKQDRDMLGSILDLAETDVESIMTHRKNMLTINADLPNKEIIELVLKSPYSRIPLWQNDKDNIVGVLHSKDILKAAFYSTKKIDEIDILKIALQPWFIHETINLKTQLVAFRERRAHFAIVVNEYGTVMGIITLEDILEEIVGEIKDEHDKGSADISFKKLKDRSYLMDGETPIRDINRELNWNLPDDAEYATIAGLVIHQAEKIPDRGEVFEYFKIRFEIVEKNKHQITKLKVKKLKAL